LEPQSAQSEKQGHENQMNRIETLSQQVRSAIAKRYAVYLATSISEQIAACDDMYLGDISHYLAVGRSAVEICIDAMTLARRDDILSVLDLPCGGGRVTRHLRALFPQAKLYVGDINPAKQDYVTQAFLAQPIKVGGFPWPPAQSI
jgi:SAM-dependent methyltransferase